VHDGAVAEVVLSFEYTGDVRELQTRFERSGRVALVVDENYGYSLRISDPNGGDDIWVNQQQDDLHGYHRA
jgi:hypothetical protein